MPVGEPHSIQKLVGVTRVGDDDFEKEDLGGVRFVPLIGVHGFQDAKGGRQALRSLPDLIGAAAEPLPAIRSEENTSELQSLMRISYAVFCLKKKNKTERLTKNKKH